MWPEQSGYKIDVKQSGSYQVVECDVNFEMGVFNVGFTVASNISYTKMLFMNVEIYCKEGKDGKLFIHLLIILYSALDILPMAHSGPED